MPSKLNDSFQTKDYNPDVLAGAYADRRIQDFVNAINAASYPHTPEETGGKVYKHCKSYLDDSSKLIGNDDPLHLSVEKKAQIRAKAIDCLNELVETLSCDNSLNPAEQRYLDEFMLFKAITDKLLAGEDIASIEKFIQAAPIGQYLPLEPQ